jgi:hypothetical protein
MEYTYISHILESFNNAENYNSKITDDIIKMKGMTGTKTRHFYNNLLTLKDARYLEIGVWLGSSTCSALYNNNALIYCIDNFLEFGGTKDIFLNNFNKHIGNNKAVFIESDCFKLDISILPKFNIFMFDGYHNYDSHYNALKYYITCLDDIFIFIVDDWNWEKVRKPTYDSIKDLNLTILFEKQVRHTYDDSVTPEPTLSTEWWNGIYIAVLKKNT